MSLRIFNPDDSCRSPLENSLLASAWQEFDCHPLPMSAESLCDRRWMREANRREARRGNVTIQTLTFVSAMKSQHPPKTEAEAVAQLAPLGAWLLSYLFRQMAVELIKFLWRRWHAVPQTPPPTKAA